MSSQKQPDRKQGVEKPPAEPPARSGVVGSMMVAVVLGAIVGVVVAAVFLPDYMIAAALGGAMMFAAVRVVILMSSDRRGLAPLENEDGSGQ